MSARILVVDDSVGVLSSICRALGLEGYEVLAAEDGETALRAAELELPDIIILDVMLPDIDGLEVCRRLRLFTSAPILFLTARDTVPDRVAGLDKGADDYLVKPFALAELLARVRALLRRTTGSDDGSLACADIRINLSTREAFRDGVLLNLSPQQFELLVAFVRHHRQVLTREQLCQYVWGYSFEGESNFVDVAVMELRKKIEANGGKRLIQTVRGFGYVLRES
ncbi:MAG: response regulator transcription factor [Dehalococcoidales bacterium]|nr:response regulator transcription factor [Dehalococcoidales bacterium]